MLNLCCAPIKPKILTKIENKILNLKYFATFDTYNRNATVLTFPSFSICELDIPMYRNYIGAGKGEDVPNTDILNIKLNLGELFEKFTEPTFNLFFPLKSTTFRYITWINEYPIITPIRHEC